MCGILGGVWRNPQADHRRRVIAGMKRLAHRGPDDSGLSSQQVSGGHLHLAQTRLSIIDLSPAGHQPMMLENGRITMVYNGEIYNYKELRCELQQLGWQFTSQTDSEVLLKAWAAWGNECLPRLVGMFAFVIYDRQDNSLTCVRDGFGIKPLYYDISANGFVFASELPALLEIRTATPKADLDRAYHYLVHADYDSTHRSFVEDIKQLAPGTLVRLDLDTAQLGAPQRWWTPASGAPSTLSFNEAVAALREQFLDNIRLHLRSDVPLGAALSGGVDSSAVVCAMRHIAPDMPIHTFSYIPDAGHVSEERWVDIVNNQVGAISHKVRAGAQDFERDLDRIITVQGEPFGSTSVYAQYCVFRQAHADGITVTLDGQGADEVLAGYDGYPGHRILSLVEQGDLRGVAQFMRNWVNWPGRSYRSGAAHFGRQVAADAVYAWARRKSGRDFRPDWLQLALFEANGMDFAENRPARQSDFRGRRVIEQLRYSLQNRGMPHLLRHGDRNAMAFSIESRVPFLTIPLADFLLSLPESYLISQNGETKSVFRAAMRGIVPDSILDRRDKIGFATSEEIWFSQMRPQLRSWLEDADDVPFLDRHKLILRFDSIMQGEQKFDWQIWRWINYIRWYRNVIM
jgi:asparagine synthase (glutamine-hydrolysing)